MLDKCFLSECINGAPKKKVGVVPPHMFPFHLLSQVSLGTSVQARSNPTLNHISGLKSVRSILNLMRHLKTNPEFAQIRNSAVRAPGWLLGRACDSRSRGPEFQPHVEQRDYFKKQNSAASPASPSGVASCPTPIHPRESLTGFWTHIPQ